MKQSKYDRLEFYVLIWDLNLKKPYMKNIFSNISIRQSLDLIPFKKLSKEEIRERLRAAFLSTYWSRYEYEIEVREYMGKGELVQVDAFEQIDANLDLITDYVIRELAN